MVWSKFHCLIPEATVMAASPFVGMEQIPLPDSRSYSYGSTSIRWYGANSTA